MLPPAATVRSPPPDTSRPLAVPCPEVGTTTERLLMSPPARTLTSPPASAPTLLRKVDGFAHQLAWLGRVLAMTEAVVSRRNQSLTQAFTGCKRPARRNWPVSTPEALRPASMEISPPLSVKRGSPGFASPAVYTAADMSPILKSRPA